MKTLRSGVLELLSAIAVISIYTGPWLVLIMCLLILSGVWTQSLNGTAFTDDAKVFGVGLGICCLWVGLELLKTLRAPAPSR